MNTTVDFFFNKASKWQEAYLQLRSIILSTGLDEECKWGKPCYTIKGSNVVLMHGFKDYCALLFHKGALLKDQKGILIQQTPNVQAARQLRFTHSKEIVKMKTTIIAYIKEAITVENAGLQVEMKKTSQFVMPEEFKKKLTKNTTLKKRSLH